MLHPVPARPCADDRLRLLTIQWMSCNYAHKAAVKSPTAVVVGPQTYRRLEMQLRGAARHVRDRLSNRDGIYRLFSVPTKELTDHDFEAHSLFWETQSQD